MATKRTPKRSAAFCSRCGRYRPHVTGKCLVCPRRKAARAAPSAALSDPFNTTALLDQNARTVIAAIRDGISPELARAALAAEEAGKGRKTVIAELAKAAA